MSAIQNNHSQPPAESKSAKKKKAKAEATARPTSAAADHEATAEQSNADAATNGVDGNYESPYLKELYK